MMPVRGQWRYGDGFVQARSRIDGAQGMPCQIAGLPLASAASAGSRRCGGGRIFAGAPSRLMLCEGERGWKRGRSHAC